MTILQRLSNWLFPPIQLDFNWTRDFQREYEEKNMNRATIIFQTSSGRYALAGSEGVIATYSRARDARRGARRAGLVVA